jgi:hypothetical protein
MRMITGGAALIPLNTSFLFTIPVLVDAPKAY